MFVRAPVYIDYPRPVHGRSTCSITELGIVLRAVVSGAVVRIRAVCAPWCICPDRHRTCRLSRLIATSWHADFDTLARGSCLPCPSVMGTNYCNIATDLQLVVSEVWRRKSLSCSPISPARHHLSSLHCFPSYSLYASIVCARLVRLFAAAREMQRTTAKGVRQAWQVLSSGYGEGHRWLGRRKESAFILARLWRPESTEGRNRAAMLAQTQPVMPRRSGGGRWETGRGM